MKKRDRIITESILDKRLSNFKVELKEEIRDEIVTLQDRLEANNQKRHDELLNRFDSFAKKTETLEDEK